MNLTPLSRPAAVRLAWALWGVFLAAIVVAVVAGNERSVTYSYVRAAKNWLAGADLYTTTGRGFLYLPQAAILYVPFTVFPGALGNVLWRVFNIAVFAVGVARVCRLAKFSYGIELFPLTSLITIPIAWSAARNGQATLVMAGLMMLALDALRHGRFWRAAACLVLAVCFKPLAIVLVLLVAALYRPMTVRLAAGLWLAAFIPWLMHDPEYVTRQYVSCGAMLQTAARLGAVDEWAQLFGLLGVAGVTVDESGQMAVRVIAAIATLAAGWFLVRRRPPERAAVCLYALAGCYLMLFNPRTENNTYALLAPAIGLACGEAFFVERRRARVLFLLGIAAGVLGSYELGARLLPGVKPIWIAPLMCVLFTVDFALRLVREMRSEWSLDTPDGQLADPEPARVLVLPPRDRHAQTNEPAHVGPTRPPRPPLQPSRAPLPALPARRKAPHRKAG